MCFTVCDFYTVLALVYAVYGTSLHKIFNFLTKFDQFQSNRDARESQRLKLVQEKYDIQWRDACDDARTLDSKAMTQAWPKYSD